ncbi:DUF6879 family protein [Streptomyces sp. NBC_01014]|uniref:DUF6879 family protein n=1 Tax=Streptomyces sp. NBC_01014 TaxID=2903719 RepID=UPI0038654098|nr:hypothetical protein OG282_17630 [Streptomyces sp. NBC_01014]
MKPNVPSFDVLLDSAQHSAVHLEMRDTYAVAEEQAHLALWDTGKWSLDKGREALEGWLALVSRTVGRGVAMRRARIVSEPASAYVAFEHFTTPLNLEAGEQVRWLPRRQALDIPLPAADFWLIDEQLVRFNLFSGEGAAVEPEVSKDPIVAALCATAFEVVWDRAVPHDNYRI